MGFFLRFLFLAVILSIVNADLNQTHVSTRGGRIIGGHLAKPGQFPFIAAIYIYNPSGLNFCGGTILNEEWILTAAHCTYQATKFTVYFGITNLSGSEPNRVTISASEYISHPGFVWETLTYDIALIKLDKKLTFNEFIQPITYLPITEVATDAPIVGIGWGLTSDTAPTVSNELNYVYLTTITNQVCRQTYGTVVQDYVICATGRTNEGGCTGDSGGPVVQINPNGVTVHVGSLSFVSGRGCEQRDPTGYTRTFDFLDFIADNTGRV